MVRLIQALVNLNEIDSQLANEMHVANEYFSSACTYFDNGNYAVGNTEIEKMNEHIEKYDDMVFEQNDLWSEIEICLEKIS